MPVTNEWKYQLRRKVRGVWCVLPTGGLCGCGARGWAPKGKSKQLRRRIARRAIQRSDDD